MASLSTCQKFRTKTRLLQLASVDNILVTHILFAYSCIVCMVSQKTWWSDSPYRLYSRKLAHCLPLGAQPASCKAGLFLLLSMKIRAWSDFLVRVLSILCPRFLCRLSLILRFLKERLRRTKAQHCTAAIEILLFCRSTSSRADLTLHLLQTIEHPSRNSYRQQFKWPFQFWQDK